jgi:hypothetical protein
MFMNPFPADPMRCGLLPRRQVGIKDQGRLANDAEPEEGRRSGRVEHIDSGRQARFGSLEQLMGFLAVVRGMDNGSVST